MKKILEAELLSIAHRILQMKNKDDVNNLYKEAKEVYEKLSILKFYENNINIEISQKELEDKIVEAYTDVVEVPNNETLVYVEEETNTSIDIEIQDESEIDNDLQDDINVEEELKEELEIITQEQSTNVEDEVKEEFDQNIEVKVDVEEEIILPTNTEIVDIITVVDEEISVENEELQTDGFINFDDSTEEVENIDEDILEEEEPLNQHLGNQPGIEIFLDLDDEEEETNKSFDDSLFGIDYNDVEFVNVKEKDEVLKNEDIKKQVIAEKKDEDNSSVKVINDQGIDKEEKHKSINDSFSGIITVGLNDRIAFEKHLFGGSSEEFNRVLSQLNTLDTLEEANLFIEKWVKPDYNNWEGKEEYEERLKELVEKRFV